MARSSPNSPRNPAPEPVATPLGRIVTVDDVKPKVRPPNLGFTPPFFLRCHSESWHVMNGKLLPSVRKMLLMPGVDNVTIRKDGAFDVRTAKYNAADKGWTVLPLDIDGEGTSYAVEPWPGVWVTRWETVHPGATESVHDTAAYIAWCESLVTRGIVELPQPHVVRKLLRNADADVVAAEAAMKASGGEPASVRELERARSVRDLLTRELDAAEARARGAA
jgi:hypothetical protein